MDDNDKKFPRKGAGKGGSKPAGPRDRSGAAGKNGKSSPGGKKPFAKRGRPVAAEGERPARDFKRSYKPREMGEGAERGEKPFRKGPRPGGKPFEKREGPRKPFGPRGDRPIAAEGERRDFKRSYKPREVGEGGGDRPFRKGPPPEGKPFERREGRKPYEPRGGRPMAAEGERGEKRFDRPKPDFSDRPKRDFADRPKRDFSDRSKRDFAGDRPQEKQGGFKPRPRPLEAAPEAGDRSPLVRVSRAEPLPMSFMQERTWRHSQTPEGSAAWTVASGFRIESLAALELQYRRLQVLPPVADVRPQPQVPDLGHAAIPTRRRRRISRAETMRRPRRPCRRSPADRLSRARHRRLSSGAGDGRSAAARRRGSTAERVLVSPCGPPRRRHGAHKSTCDDRVAAGVAAVALVWGAAVPAYWICVGVVALPRNASSPDSASS